VSPVHLACGEVAALAIPRPVRWLSDGERTRMAAMKTEKRRAQFLAARWQARWLLAEVLGGAPVEWELAAPLDAPPGVIGRPDLHLSISHSGGRTACALATQPVGLDLEQPKRRRDVAGLVALCCTAGEQALFAGLSEDEADALFYQLWTVKEAWLKSRGEWIAPHRLLRIDARPHDEGQVRTWSAGDWRLAVTAVDVQWWTEAPQGAGRWWVRDEA
jgi:4'-phosphopantetheinyl transferase